MGRLIKYSRICVALTCAAAIGISSGWTQAQEDDDATLRIGSKAPDLDVGFWLSDDNGLLLHTRKLESNHVYVIEFWATWCGPCIGVMPLMAELQEKYKDQKVQIISISDEDLDTVQDFLERKIPGDPEKRTFADLTSSYCLTTDPDKSVKEDYFRVQTIGHSLCIFGWQDRID